MILSASVILMIAYILVQIDVLILRKRLPKAPRNFKVPGGPVIPVIGMIGAGWMGWYGILQRTMLQGLAYTVYV